MALDRSILRSPVITEKATILREGNTYTFRVDPRANKIQIRQAVESIFEVKVKSVRKEKAPGRCCRNDVQRQEGLCEIAGR
jgi:large subunit ribosomal protein L23